jgi:hypothetical protein
MSMNNLENISRLLKSAKSCVDVQEKAFIQNSVKIASNYSILGSGCDILQVYGKRMILSIQNGVVVSSFLQ